jgi:acyl-CoA dehydrogenase
MGITGSHFVRVNADVAPETARYYQQLTRFSAALAFLADVSMGTLGGELKRKEKLSARLGDILSLTYLCSATLRRYELEGRQAADAPLMHWAIWDAMFKAQNAFEGVISNFPNPFAAALARIIVFPLGRPYEVPSDQLGHEVAALLIAPSATRDRLTDNIFIGREEDDPVALIDRALDATIVAEPIQARIRTAIKEGKLDGSVAPDAAADTLTLRAVASGIVTADEAHALAKHQALVARVVAVDDFDSDLGASMLVPALQALQRQAERLRAAA